MPLLLLVALGAGLAGNHWSGDPEWTPDGLYYQAKVYELQATVGGSQSSERSTARSAARSSIRVTT